MTLRHMRYFIPEASRYGPAILRGWRLVLGDTGEEERVSARIKQTGDTGDVVEGVVYEISAWARGRLRTLERGPHREVHVQPECMGEAIEAFAFVHLAIDDAPATSGPGADLQIMIEGAEENHYSGLAQRLRDYQREHRHSAAVPHPRRPDEPTFGAVGASELPQSDL